jgi:hypothetical protein
MINISSNFSSAFDGVERHVVDQMHEMMAQQLADKMRELGRENADAVDLQLESDTDNPKYQIDGERVRSRGVRSRANEILGE